MYQTEIFSIIILFLNLPICLGICPHLIIYRRECLLLNNSKNFAKNPFKQTI